MSAATPPVTVAMDRRQLLRVGLLGGAVIASGAAMSVVGSGALPRTPGLLGGAVGTTTGDLPFAAAWERIIGHDVVLVGAGVGRTVAQVVDVRDAAVPSPGVTLTGDAYSLLVEAPRLPRDTAVTVTVHHAALVTPTMMFMPVGDRGSWEAVVDRRVPVRTR